jgi:formylmethanofuran dehydrogenase subunit E
MNKGDPREEIRTLLRDGDLTGLLLHAARLHGHYCPGLAFGVVAGRAGMKRLGFDNTGMEELVAVVECNNCFVDGIQMTTGCSLGNNALIYKDLGKTAVTIMSRKTGCAVRIALKPRQWDREDSSELDREAADLFRRIVKERQQDPEASKRMQELFREKSFRTLAMPEDELFDIADVPATFPEYAPIVDSDACTVCGEVFMSTKKAPDGDEPTCLTCAGVDCMAVLGAGICVLKKSAFV